MTNLNSKKKEKVCVNEEKSLVVLVPGLCNHFEKYIIFYLNQMISGNFSPLALKYDYIKS